MKFLLAFLFLFLFSTLSLAAQPISEATIDPGVVMQLIQAHAWWALAAFVIAFVVRMLKDDSFVLPAWATVPSAYRPALALGLGVIAGVLSKLAGGTDWKTALLWGLSAATAAIFSHTLIVEAARKGRDVGEPKDDAVATPRTSTRGLARIEVLAFVATFGIMGLTASCAWLKANEAPILHVVNSGCSVVDLLAPELGPVCLSAEDIAKAIEQLAGTPAGKPATLRCQGVSGTVYVIKVPSNDVEKVAWNLVAAHRAAVAR